MKGRNEPRITAVRPKEGPVGEAFAENRLVREHDLVAVPLQGAAGPLGALVLIAPRVEAPDALLEALAAQAAAAWDHARLREDTARREKDSPDRARRPQVDGEEPGGAPLQRLP